MRRGVAMGSSARSPSSLLGHIYAQTALVSPAADERSAPYRQRSQLQSAGRPMPKRSHMKRTVTASPYPSPLWGGWPPEGRSGGGEQQRDRACKPPRRPPLRSADPPHKGGGIAFRQHSNRERRRRKSTIMNLPTLLRILWPPYAADAGKMRNDRLSDDPV